MREGPSNRLAGAGLKPPSAAAPLRGVVVSGEGKCVQERRESPLKQHGGIS